MNPRLRLSGHACTSLNPESLALQVLKGLLKVDAADHLAADQLPPEPGPTTGQVPGTSTPESIVSPGGTETPVWAQQPAVLSSALSSHANCLQIYASALPILLIAAVEFGKSYRKDSLPKALTSVIWDTFLSLFFAFR